MYLRPRRVRGCLVSRGSTALMSQRIRTPPIFIREVAIHNNISPLMYIIAIPPYVRWQQGARRPLIHGSMAALLAEKINLLFVLTGLFMRRYERFGGKQGVQQDKHANTTKPTHFHAPVLCPSPYLVGHRAQTHQCHKQIYGFNCAFLQDCSDELAQKA